MKTVNDLLKDADPLRHEPQPLEAEHQRRRHAVVAAASGVPTSPSVWVRTRVARVAAVVVIGVGIVAIGSQIWLQDGAMVPQPTMSLVELGAEHPITADDVGGGQGRVVQQELDPPAEVRDELPGLEFRPTPEFPGGAGRAQAFPRAGAGAQQGGPVRVGGDIRPPTKLFDVSPIYPDEAIAAGVQGVVILDVVIGVYGSVIETEVVRSEPLLDEAAVEAVTQWIFETTLLGGEPVEVAMYVTVNFTLNR